MNTTQIACKIQGVADSERQVAATLIDGQPDKAFVQHPVIVKFRTGSRLHTSLPLAWRQPDGSWRISATANVHNRHARVIGWKDAAEQTNSGWTG